MRAMCGTNLHLIFAKSTEFQARRCSSAATFFVESVAALN